MRLRDKLLVSYVQSANFVTDVLSYPNYKALASYQSNAWSDQLDVPRTVHGTGSSFLGEGSLGQCNELASPTM